MRKQCLVAAFLAGLALAVARPAAADCTDEQWLRQVYADGLYRAPSDNEATYWLGFLGQQVGRQTVALGILLSDEAILNYLGGDPQLVKGAFQRLLGRDPQIGELVAVATIVFFGGGSDFDADAYIINQLFDEYEARAVQTATCDPADQILNQMFLDALGRPLGDSDRQTQLYVAAIDAINQRLTNQQGGPTIFDVYLAVELLAESADRAVNGAYSRFLRRPANQAELTTYSPIIQQDTSIEYLEAFLAAQAGYCDPKGFVGIGNIVGVPPAQVPPQLVINFSGGGGDVIIVPGPPVALQVPPVVAAANAATRAFQAHIAAQDLVIQADTTQIAAQDQAIQAANAQIAAQTLVIQANNNQIAAQAAVIQASGNQIAGQAEVIQSLSTQVANDAQALASANQTVSSVVLVAFGYAADQNAATAARNVANGAIQTAIAKAGASNSAVVEAQGDFARGVQDMAALAWTRAVKDFSDAYHSVARFQ